MTDFTGEKVRSYPATAVVRGRVSLRDRAGQLAGIRSGSRPCSARNISTATWVRIRARSSAGTG